MAYLDTLVCEWHWNQLNISDQSVAVFHIPCPFEHSFKNKIDWAVESFKHVIILCSELHADTVDFIQSNQHPKIRYFVCGYINDVQTERWMDWFITTSEIYKNNNLLDQLTPYTVKPKTFDALLGWAKPHRQIAYDYLKNNNQIILSYLKNRAVTLEANGWITAENCEVSETVRNTITKINYHGQDASISQIIPFSVYNQTAYSIVAETNYDNSYSFFTEKIVKPILAERLFVVFAGQHYLKNLRRLGFQTFNGIIDESYDNEPDMLQRYSRLNEQINYLLAQPQSVILEKIKPITEHNKKLMLSNDWLGNTHSAIRNIIL